MQPLTSLQACASVSVHKVACVQLTHDKLNMMSQLAALGGHLQECSKVQKGRCYEIDCFACQLLICM